MFIHSPGNASTTRSEYVPSRRPESPYLITGVIPPPADGTAPSEAWNTPEYFGVPVLAEASCLARHTFNR